MTAYSWFTLGHLRIKLYAKGKQTIVNVVKTILCQGKVLTTIGRVISPLILIEPLVILTKGTETSFK